MSAVKSVASIIRRHNLVSSNSENNAENAAAIVGWIKSYSGLDFELGTVLDAIKLVQAEICMAQHEISSPREQLELIK